MSIDADAHRERLKMEAKVGSRREGYTGASANPLLLLSSCLPLLHWIATSLEHEQLDVGVLWVSRPKVEEMRQSSCISANISPPPLEFPFVCLPHSLSLHRSIPHQALINSDQIQTREPSFTDHDRCVIRESKLVLHLPKTILSAAKLA